MASRYMPDFMGQHADDFVRCLGFHQEAGMDENPLPARDEGVQATVVDDMDRHGARIEAGCLE